MYLINIRGLGALNYQKGAIFGNFSSVYTKNHPEENFVMGLPVILLNHLEDNPAIILSQI